MQGQIVMLLCMAVAVLGLACVGGCGNVTLRGDALTAAEMSTMDAYQAAQRSGAVEAMRTGTPPTWEQSFLIENFKQWRFFVRSACKNLTWGPKLPDERSE